MRPSKRTFDIVISVGLSIVLAPAMLTIALVIFVFDGWPIFYISKRMKSPIEDFNLVKFRTMKVVSVDSGVSGGDKSDRITRVGRIIRKSRIDELPQLWNVLRGDMSFVGPRPPLRQYVERFPSIYKNVLQSRPGVTGLASIYYHKHEEYLLAQTISSDETDAVYCRACIPRKARLDLMYRNNQSMCFDVLLMLKSVFKVLR